MIALAQEGLNTIVVLACDSFSAIKLYACFWPSVFTISISQPTDSVAGGFLEGTNPLCFIVRLTVFEIGRPI